MENCLFIIICKDIGKITIGEEIIKEIIKMYELMKNIINFYIHIDFFMIE